MNMPFSREQFLGVFEAYNAAFPFMPVLTYALGVTALVLALRAGRENGNQSGNESGRQSDLQSQRLVPLILGAFWIWNGLAYHIGYFSAINPAAIIFGGLFTVQGVLFAVAGLRGRGFRFDGQSGIRRNVGVIFVAYAMVVYPVLGSLLGHSYPASPVFGMAPCPTTIFTFGIILLADRSVSPLYAAIPFLWTIVGFGAAVNLGIYEDFGLTVSGVLGYVMVLVGSFQSRKNKKRKEKNDEKIYHLDDDRADSVEFLARHGLG